MKFPYGQCECPHPNPTEHKPDACPGPAALRVTRDGKVYKLCTRCDLITDQDKEVLITENDDLTAFLEWDDFGLVVVLGRLLSDVR